jgi:GNAT superfamily N-acetyltransferase
MSTSSLTPLVRSWIDGWVVSRGAADPVPEPWGWTIDVGEFAQSGRHVLPDGDEATVRRLAAERAAPGRWLKVFLPQVSIAPGAPHTAEDVVAPWLVPGWTLGTPGFLMTTELRHTPVDVPDGHRLRTWVQGGVIRAAVTAPDGTLAARGQITPIGATAVADRIATSPLHRRKGLGSVVMGTLQHAALERGARTGVLVGTVDGRALYEALGWQAHAPMVSVTFGAP